MFVKNESSKVMETHQCDMLLLPNLLPILSMFRTLQFSFV